MLSDPVAEAFGLIHRHPSGENFWHGWKIANVLCHPGHKQQHFKVFSIGTNSSREQCQLMAIISKQFISLPGHSFTTTCCFEITWVKANQPDIKIASILWHTWLKFFFRKPPFCDTHVTHMWHSFYMYLTAPVGLAGVLFCENEQA